MTIFTACRSNFKVLNIPPIQGMHENKHKSTDEMTRFHAVQPFRAAAATMPNRSQTFWKPYLLDKGMRASFSDPVEILTGIFQHINPLKTKRVCFI
jgi:hypothetical protein